MKVLQNMKAMLLSIALAIGVGTLGFAMFANAQSVPASGSVSQGSQKDSDKETNDDATSADNQQDGETNDDGTVTKSPSTN
jgi:hypothetical protein